jgi:hypothetical protein
MKIRALTCLLVSWLLAGFLPPASAAQLPGSTVPEGLGVNIHFTDPRPGEMEMLAGAGFRWIRMDFSWGGTERERGRYDFSPYDRLLAALDAHKIRAVLIFDYSNPHYDGGLSPASDEGRAAFARWAAAAAGHFRNRGVLWEMYNEPNIAFWKPKPDVEQYVKLALAVGKALHEAELGELYMGPASSEMPIPFLEECFKAGLLQYWAAVSVHPYRHGNPETVAFDYARIRKLIGRYAPKGKTIPIISGEWGYSSAWKHIGEAEQGKLLPREFLTNLANGVPLSIWYDWHDDGRDPNEPEHHFGTVRHQYLAGKTPVYEPKSAYLAARTLTRLLGGYRFQEAIKTGNRHDFVVKFVRNQGRDVRWVAWTADAPHKVVIALPAGRYRATGHTGQPLPPLVGDAKGLELTLGDAPVYLVPERSRQ